MKAIQFKNVWEMYRIKFIEDGKAIWDNFWALKDISFEIGEKEALGVIGANGSGKSTILKLIAGMLKPDRGEVIVKGRISGLLELGAGFEPEMTGTENIHTIASLHGLNQEQIKNKAKRIADFAEIGRFINAPVKCYSQGMFVRLAFAIAIHIEPDILLIDDTLAVGDEYFQRKCIKKIFEIKEQGKAIIFVTHDMNMLRRLCKRVLFLREGRVVKDNLVDKVIPLYTQMVGTKDGVGILEKDHLNLVFNNGRMFLNWQDRFLTPNSGAYTVFLIRDKWYSSLQADWEVKKEGGKKLVATGKFYQLALTQIWSLEIVGNYEIKWDIELRSEEPFEIQEAHTNIMLTNEYKSWFTALEKGVFHIIDDKTKNWQAMLDGNVSRRCIGVKAVADSKITSLVFEQCVHTLRSQSQIFNSDYLSNCRILQYKQSGLQSYFKTQANNFIYFSGKLIINHSDINDYLEKLQDEFILTNEKLKWIFNHGQNVILYKDTLLNKTSNIGTSICANGKLYHSNSAHWQVRKENNNKLIAKGTWHNLPVEQIFEIEINRKNAFLWKIGLQVNESIDIEEQDVYFMYHKDYQYWFTKYIKGSFPQEFLENEIDMVQKCIQDGVIGLQSRNILFPTVSIKFSKELDNFAKILNSDFYNKARILRIDRVEPEQKTKFLPGFYPCFAIEVIINKDKKISHKDLTQILGNKKLKFIFDNGRGRIYWDDIELTKRLGLYTSLRSGGRWYDSNSSAIWRIEEKKEDKIKAVGRWLHLPIIQYWDIRLEEANIIRFNITMKVVKKIEADRLQTNVMFSERYKEWFANKEKGVFPSFKSDIDDDWEVVWPNHSSQNENDDYIGVQKYYEERLSLPSVVFLSEETDSGCSFNIVNSDLYHRGRVLQYLKNKLTQILPGRYAYFAGKIVIQD